MDSIRAMVLGCLQDEMKQRCAEDDLFGVHEENILWWFERKTGELHFFSGGDAEKKLSSAQDAAPGIDAVDEWEIRRMIVHEGIETFSVELPAESEIEELILPDSLRAISDIKGHIEKMKIPRSVERLAFDALFVDCGGHWDPVEYAVKQLILPSTIVIDGVDSEDISGALPLCEPIEYWEEIVLYGDEKIPDLMMWYDANVFFSRLVIRYPKEWDEGIEGSYADEIVALIREQKPEKPCFGMAPLDYEAYTEEDYQDIRGCFVSYDERDGVL